MNDVYEKLEALIKNMEGYYTDAEAHSALPKLVSAIMEEEVTANGAEIIAICELVLQVCFNGINEMDPETRNLFFPYEVVSWQAFRL